MERKNYFNLTRIIIFYIFHGVGLVGFLLPALQPIFKILILYHLLWITALLIWDKAWLTIKNIGYAAFVFLIGMFAEIIGVQTGMLFGNYAYTPMLGWSIYGVPLLIGLLWMALSLAVYSVLYSYPLNFWFKGILFSAALTSMDILIEPFAIHVGMWHWQDGSVPFFNYISWFLVGFCIFIYLNWVEIPVLKKSVALHFLLAMSMFFAIHDISQYVIGNKS